MRDGLSVIALVASSVALIVALAGLSRGPGEPETLPAEQLEQAERRLGKLMATREAMRKEIDELGAKVTRAIELGPVSKGGGVDKAQVQGIVNDAVEAALRTRLEAEAEKAGAPVAKRTVVEQQFTGLVAEITKTLALDEKKGAAVKSVLVHTRGELNRAYRNPDAKARASLAKAVRARADRDLAKVLSPEEFKNFKTWRKTTTNAYVARFFGLKPAPKAPAPKAKVQKTPAPKAPAPKAPKPRKPVPKTPAKRD